MSSWSTQRYGKNYRYTKPTRLQDWARYKVRVPKKARYSVYARWPANAAYNGRALYYVRTTAGWRAKAVNQRKTGGKWVRLGVYPMPAGDRVNVKVASRSRSNGLIIADGVMVKR